MFTKIIPLLALKCKLLGAGETAQRLRRSALAEVSNMVFSTQFVQLTTVSNPGQDTRTHSSKIKFKKIKLAFYSECGGTGL